MTSPNGLVCFTNCLLPQEDGNLLQSDLWIDEGEGIIVDAKETFYVHKKRPGRTIDLGGNILSPGLIDIQINGAYGFDFSVYEGDDEYRQGMQMMAEKIVETGVTSLLPTVITQERSIYRRLLPLLQPFSSPQSATLLGWHAEGPFLHLSKRGAHAPPFLLTADKGVKSFEQVYGEENLVERKDWLLPEKGSLGIRMITAAPEVPGVMDAFSSLSNRGIIMSIGHSTATTAVATAAVKHGGRLITHLFNAMPQFHHRDPSIVGLLGASPGLNTLEHVPLADVPCEIIPPKPEVDGTMSSSDSAPSSGGAPVVERKGSRSALQLEKGTRTFERPFYGIIVDGIHCHPNSVRLAYAAHPNGCILITDAMKILDPNLGDGVHEWRDGKRFVKEGERLYLEGTDTLAGSVVTLDKCIRNFSRFTGCSLGEAIKCATYNPATCLGISDKKGTLRPGADADLVVLDRHGYVFRFPVKMISCMTITHLHAVSRPRSLSLRMPTSIHSKFEQIPPELIMAIIEQALSDTPPKVIASLSKTIHSFLNRVLYRTVILRSQYSIDAFHWTERVSPHLLSQVKKLVVTLDHLDTALSSRISEIVAACHNLQAIILPTLTSLIPDLAIHHGLKEVVTPGFEDDETLNRLSPRADTITHLRFTEPNQYGWLSPCEMLAKCGNPPNLSRIQFSRRAGANEENDVLFAEEVVSILSSYPKLRLVVVSVFKDYAWSADSSAVEDSHIWRILSDLKRLDDRFVLLEGHRKEWKKDYEEAFHPADSIDSRFWAQFDC